MKIEVQTEQLEKSTGPESTLLNTEVIQPTKVTERGHWGNQIEFILSCVGYAVGLSNIWRFPYLCMRNGGGAFLIPYFVSLFLCGMPLFFLELAIGQFSAMSPLQIWAICPLFKGLGISMVILSGIVCIYYNVIICWTIYYLFKSFTKSLPWSECGSSWNTPLCLAKSALMRTTDASNMPTDLLCNDTMRCGINVTISMDGMDKDTAARIYANLSANVTIPWKSPTEEFWQNSVLELTDGIEDLGGVKWDLVGTFFLSWLLVFLCLCKGVKSSGKVVYVMATAPYLFLTILLIRGALLPGAIDGIKYYIIPEWSKLLEFQVWAEAMLQIFYSLGPAWGGLITMSSYNKFHNNCLRDGILVPIVTCLSSFYGGFVIFSVIGFMAHEANLSVKDVVTSGPGLAFIVYPEAISKMPISPLWAICFFCMLLTVGLDSQFGTFETMASSVVDAYPKYLRKHKVLYTVVICVVEFLIGIPFVTRGGMYVFQIVDWYSAVSVVFIAVFEICSLAWIYGYDRLCYDIQLMTGSKPGLYWKVCWCFVSPIMLTIITIYSCVAMETPTYGDYEYPWWALMIGWTVAFASIIPIPLASIYCLLKQQGTFLQRLKASLKPSKEWGPVDPACKEMYKYSRDSVFISSPFNMFKSNKAYKSNAVKNDL